LCGEELFLNQPLLRELPLLRNSPIGFDCLQAPALFGSLALLRQNFGAQLEDAHPVA
jgi:hypothetical protein